MARKVTAMDVKMAAAMAGGVGNVAGFCREQGISRQTFYKWRRRFRAEGVPGLAERSRRPDRHPGRVDPGVEEAVVRARKELAERGHDQGADAVVDALSADAQFLGVVPSRATVHRVLVRRGQIVPAPRKRPRSAGNRFLYDRPNGCWQSDWTEWHLADGAKAAIAATLDDHSRYLVAIAAAPGDGDAALVWSVMAAAIGQCGVPAMSLTDNGLCYSGSRRGFSVDFETNLRALGVNTVCSSPYHPQTCGKIERSWQTLKRWLRAHGPFTTIAELNQALAGYREHYNHHRRHRALPPATPTPAAAFAATVKARPADRPLPAPTAHTRVTFSRDGVIAHTRTKIGLGTRWAGHTVDVISDGDYVAIFTGTTLVRTLTIDPTQPYQPRLRRNQAHSLSAMS
jgi:transposase InsO family protein